MKITFTANLTPLKFLITYSPVFKHEVVEFTNGNILSIAVTAYSTLKLIEK